MPPSPSLSARITNSTYLTDTVMISDQKTSDSTPYTLPTVTGMACTPSKHSRSAYSGLVPMSPKTTPRAERIRTPVREGRCAVTGS
jgi:hypothetical protein